MLRDIGQFLMALGEIPGLAFLKKIGRNLSNVGYKSDRIINSGKRLKKRMKKDDDKAA
jgi:hypothetical protein